MKKCLFALLAGAALFAGCEKAQEQEVPEVSFETAIPIVSDEGVATFSLISDYAGTETVKVPVKFSSSNGAVQGTDYTVSAEEFVLGGTSQVSKITVTPLIYGSKKDITAEITVPEGFKAGKYVKSTFTVSDKFGYVSFSSKKAIMTETATVSINVLNENGLDKKVNEDTEFTVSDNTEKSTAIEGTNFKFTEGKTAKVEKGKSSTAIQIEFLGESVDEEHNVLVLDLVENPKYTMGQNIQTTITLVGSAWKFFDGKWNLSKIIDDKKSLASAWALDESAMAGFPEENKEDSFTLDFSAAKFVPSFKSSLKNYFLGESNITTSSDKITVRDNTLSGKYTLDVIELDNINRYFSATETSELDKAFLGMTISDDHKTLTLFFIDHESHSFFTGCYEGEYNSWFYNEGKRPTATMGGVFFRIEFTKAE